MSEPRWHEFARRVRDVEGKNDADKICRVAVSLLSGLQASISLFVDNAYLALAETGPVALLLDETQFTLGDGPVFEVQTSGIPLVIEDTFAAPFMSASPAFGPIVQAKGIRSIATFPLRVGGASLGSLNVYREKSGPLDTQQYADGLIAASFALSEAIDYRAGIAEDIAQGELPERFATTNLQIAAGMVAEALNCTIVESLVMIRARAFADDVPVTQIARMIKDRKLMLQR
jgi:GAF domain-containing protein